MAIITVGRELREHEDSYTDFPRIVFFAIMHIVFTMICVAFGVSCSLADDRRRPVG